MADSETDKPSASVDFPFEEVYETGTGWRKFVEKVFNQRFAGENFRVRLFTQKEKRVAVPQYDISLLVMWHLTEMTYVAETPSVYNVAKRFEDPDWQAARLVLMNITGASRNGKKLRIKFCLA